MPNREMRLLHQRMIYYLRNILPRDQTTRLLRCAVGGRKGQSPLTNVKPHRPNRYFYLTDIKGAFASVQVDKMTAVLAALDTKLELAAAEKFLQQYFFTTAGCLATGAPASPDLFNLYVAYLVDQPLSACLVSRDIAYTRYIDDLTFSSPTVIDDDLRRQIRKIITAVGFVVNHQKSQVLDIKKGTIVINGIGLEDGGRVFVPRHFTHRLSGLLHLARQKKVKPEVVHGMMGIFLPVIKDQGTPNETERKILREYGRFRKHQPIR